MPHLHFSRRRMAAILLIALIATVGAAVGLWRSGLDPNGCSAEWKARIIYEKLAGHLSYVGWPDIRRHVLEPCYDRLDPHPQERTHHLEDKMVEDRKWESYQTDLGKFWVPGPGKDLLTFLVWEITVQRDYESSAVAILPGDIVIDCGAHVGVFCRYALRRGATSVVAIEPDPINLACLEANLVQEIAEGRVTVVKAGVWSKRTRLPLFEAAEGNSGSHSFVRRESPNALAVEGVLVVPLDEVVEELKLDRVDFVKMDIEGAERQALDGATQTMERFKPKMAICTYHIWDDASVIPAIVKKVQPVYQIRAKDLYILDGRVNTKVLFFH